MLSRRAALVFGAADVLTALVIFVGVFVGLPSRWLAVDAPAFALVVGHVGSAAGLLSAARWGRAFARATAAAALAVGVALVTTLALTAAWLRGVYGSVGAGGALIFALVAALVVPYLVALPAVKVIWLARGAGDEQAR